MKKTVLTSFTILCLLSTVFLMGLSFNIQTAKAESTKLYLNPSIVYTQVGETFVVDIAVADVEDLYSWQVNMSFNADALSIVNVTEGDFLKGQPEGTFFIIGRIEESWALFACSTIGQYPGVTGSGTLAMLEFEAISEGESVLDINTEGTSMQKLNPPPSDPPLEDIPFTALDGIVYIYTPRTWTVDDDAPADFSSIKEAINSPQVMDGDTIYVYNGTYYESVVVDKAVLLIGESKNAIIDGGISIEADSVTIRDFTIQGMGVVVGTFFEPTINATIRENTLVNGGISIQNQPVPSPVFGNHTIEENTIINASVGIRMLGSVGNKIIGNTLRDNDAGIVLEQDADNTTALDNQVEGCGVGMHISSFNNTLSGNDMNDNVYNLGFHQHGAYPNAIDTSNTINGRPVYFVVDQSNILVDPISYPSPGYLALIDCANVTVKDFILSGNGQGILLQGGEDNTLVNNTLVDNVVGLQVLSSDRNELANNTMSDNGIGMWLVRSSLNTIANNDLGNNSRSILNDLPQARVIYENLRLDFGWASGALILKWDSSSNLIVGNNMTDSDIGMFFPYPSINNTLRNNTMTNNLLNFGIEITQYFSSYIHDIDDSNTVNGKPIIYWVNEHEKQVPEDAGYVAVINSSDITIKNLDISNNMPGILIVSSSNSLISGNNIADCPSGIIIKETVDAIPPTQSYPSTNITVHNNTAVGCGVGISLYVGGEGHTVSQNDFSGNLAGIYVSRAEHNLISGNLVTNCTYWGYDKVPHEMWWWYSPVPSVGCVGICIETSNATVEGNTIGYNDVGMTVGLMYRKGNSTIYHNNFINSTHQLIIDSINVWDNGYPSGGNYWSDYNGTDLYSGPYQNETGCDGIGDTAHIIDENNQDDHPLMGMFSDFNATSESTVQTICNSTISDFQFNGTAISFNVTGEDGTTGFCRICIPTSLMKGTLRVFVNGIEILPSPETLPCPNSTHNYLYFTYEHSTQKVVIASDTMPPTISVLSPENKTYTVSDVPLTFTVSESTSWIGYSLDSQNNVTISGNTTLIGLSDGTHTITVYANDTAGNMGCSDIVHFTIDTTPPSISITSPENKTYATTDIPLTFTVDESVSWMAYSLDGQADMTISGNTTLYGLSEGSHSLTVHAEDTTGNTGASEKIYFTVETQPSPLWMQWWFWVAVVLVALAIAGAIYFLKRR